MKIWIRKISGGGVAGSLVRGINIQAEAPGKTQDAD